MELKGSVDKHKLKVLYNEYWARDGSRMINRVKCAEERNDANNKAGSVLSFKY